MKILDAYRVAADFHRGQVDASGCRYIDHLARVFLRVVDAGGSRSQQLAALLHDALEDTHATRAKLELMGFGADVLDMVDALTHGKNEPYADYLARVAAQPGAVLVKVADVLDNSDPVRLLELAAIDPGKAERLQRKYEAALLFLQKA